MTGSERQIRWAEDIQSGLVAEIDNVTSRPEWREIYHERAARLIAERTEAKWWIDHRGQMGSPKQILRTLAERLGDKPFGEDNWTTESV